MLNIKGISIQYLPDESEGIGRNLMAGKFLWPGFSHEYSYYAKPTYGGKYRYVTGLEEDEVPEERKQEVREAKAILEKWYGKGTLEPTNEDFWKERKITINKKNTFLNLDTPDDLLTYCVVKAGGIYEISPSFEEAATGSMRKRWYLVEPSQQADLMVSDDRTVNRAIAALEEIDEKGTFDDLFLIHKVLITSDRGTTKQTPKSAIYKDLSDFIHGKIVKTDKRKTPKQFIEAAKALKSDKKIAFITAYIKDGLYFNYLTTSKDGKMENIETRTKYGFNVQDAVGYLSKPSSQDELENLKNKVEKRWSE